MNLEEYGKSILPTDAISINPYGFSITVGEETFFMSFDEYPEFLGATVKQIYNVWIGRFKDDLEWPDVDFSLELDALRHPERFPLRARRLDMEATELTD